MFTKKIILFLYLISFVSLSSNEVHTNEKSLVDKLNLILSMQKEDRPGVSVLLKKNNDVIYKVSKGLANKAKRLSISSSTGFRLGSISKPFTALAILTLVESESLSLDDDVTKFIPELPLKWKGITIKHLLSHRVFISEDFFSDSNIGLANLSTNHDVVKFISAKNIQVKALTSDKAIYCNSCYVLLAQVIEISSGISFSDYLRQKLFLE